LVKDVKDTSCPGTRTTGSLRSMEVAAILSDSVRYSARLFEQLDKLFVLAVFSLIPLVNLLVLGYLVRVIRESPVSSLLPPLDSWGRMFVDGINLLVISLCYTAAGIALSIALFYMGSTGLALLGTLIILLGFLLLPIAIVHYVRTGEPVRAFSLGEIWNIVSRRGSVDYFLFVIVIFVVPLPIFAVLILIPYLGWFLALLAVPVVGTFIARASALAYGM